ncbi:MAG: capsular biosynthesis protein [Gemmiger sp.]|nr:capsular biosynthesis protein [Gemmiger sp.]
MSRSLVDLHCHILPGIDDGAKTIEDSAALLQQELKDGVAGIVFTPHFYYERTTPALFVENRKQAFRQVANYAKQNKLPLAAKLGAEVYFTRVLPTLELSHLAFAGTRYILIELPTTHHPGGIEDTLFEICQQGYTPILAHVERYPYVTEDPTLLYNWVSSGVLAQINASGLLRGGPGARLLHKYMGWNLVHLICSDAHSMAHRPPNLRAAYDLLPQAVAHDFSRNAVNVFLGRDFTPPEPQKPVYRLGRWV